MGPVLLVTGTLAFSFGIAELAWRWAHDLRPFKRR